MDELLTPSGGRNPLPLPLAFLVYSASNKVHISGWLTPILWVARPVRWPDSGFPQVEFVQQRPEKCCPFSVHVYSGRNTLTRRIGTSDTNEPRALN